MTEDARACESDATPVESSGFRWGSALLGALLGAVLCAVSYWPVSFALRDAFDVHAFPPGGAAYWLCWWLPLAVVAGLVGPLVFPRRPRAVAIGFLAGLLPVGAVMCAFGYSVDSMPLYM